MTTIQLGAFDLVEPLGRGGMGVVWRGRHRDTGTPVAVKVMTADRMREEVYASAFQVEAQSIAALNHPGVVLLLDIGQVTAEVEELTFGAFTAGSPYLVMELASGGSLDQLAGAVQWSWIRRVMLEVLDALAHAHARGIVHRDIKPGNILICTDQDSRPGLKIADFGIAQMEQDDQEGEQEDAVRGSPHYMPPEQIAGQWRRYGPWTDIYALGVCVYEWIVGFPPYRGTLHEIIKQHFQAPVPTIPQEFAVPEGLREWVSRALAKHPAERFQSAADAAAHVLAIEYDDEPFAPQNTQPAIVAAAETLHLEHNPATFVVNTRSDTFASGSEKVRDALETMIRRVDAAKMHAASVEGNATGDNGPPTGRSNEQVSNETAVSDGSLIALGATQAMARDHAALPAQERSAPNVAGVVPESWRRPAPPLPPTRLIGAGLSLFHLRPVPFVGRTTERDTLWNALRECAREGQPRAVTVAGASGSGKSRLVRWVTRRAQELGVVTSMGAVHGPLAGAADGVGPMIARFLRIDGLDTDAALRFVETNWSDLVVDAHDRRALVTLAVARRDGAKALVRFESTRERFMVIERLLRQLTRSRPVTMWLDDAQWGEDAIALAEHLMATDLSVLIVLTVREEALSERPIAADSLDRLHACVGADVLPLGRMHRREQSELVHTMLGLDDAVAARVTDRTAGNPLYAVQLIGDWVERGLLVAGERGFTLTDDGIDSAPSSLRQIWSDRLDRFLEDWGADAERALEVAAALGQDVQQEEWTAACGAAQVSVPPRIVAELRGHRLATPFPGGWSFSHGMLREVLEARARTNEYWSQACNHAAHAAMAAVRADERGHARIGRLLLQADRPDEAHQYLIQGASRADQAGEYRAALLLLSEATEALRRMRCIQTDPRWGEVRLLRAAILDIQGSQQEAVDEACALLEDEHQRSNPAIEAGAYEARANVERQRGNLSEARELASKAVAIRRTLGDATALGRALRMTAWVNILQGSLDEAENNVEQARAAFVSAADGYGEAKCLRSLGDIWRNRDEMQRAAACFAEARDRFADQGSVRGVSECVHGIAETDRLTGNLEAAEAGYRRSIELDLSIGARDPTIARLNLGLVQTAREDFAGARSSLERVLNTFRSKGQDGYAGVAHICLVPVAAGLRDWTSFDAHADEGLRQVDSAGICDPDIAESLELAAAILGRAPDAAKHVARRIRALQTARAQWVNLNNATRAADVGAMLDGIVATSPA